MSTIEQFVSLLANPVPYQAFLAGVVGSISYYTSLRLGFIDGDQRESILMLFGSGPLIAWFSIIGGSVATIFQLAQSGNFAPFLRRPVLRRRHAERVTRRVGINAPGLQATRRTMRLDHRRSPVALRTDAVSTFSQS
jgi:hypothetical protein